MLVDELETDGLVVRTTSPADRRTRLVELTASGRRRAAKAERVLAEPPAALAQLDDGELAMLAQLLARAGTAHAPTATGQRRSSGADTR